MKAYIITTGADYEVGEISEIGFLDKENAIKEAERLAELHNIEQKVWYDRHNTPEEDRIFYMVKREGKELEWYSNGTYIEIIEVELS